MGNGAASKSKGAQGTQSAPVQQSPAPETSTAKNTDPAKNVGDTMPKAAPAKPRPKNVTGPKPKNESKMTVEDIGDKKPEAKNTTTKANKDTVQTPKDVSQGSSGKQQRHKLYFPTVDDVVFETFYHKDGREMECMYMNGQRFYLDSWKSKEWQVFPMKWYDEGMLITNSIINDKEHEPIIATHMSKNKSKKDSSINASDDREGWITHPKRGKIPTYIFEERHNVHCFFDIYSGMWLRLPLGWELGHDTVKKMVETVEASIPAWNDRYEILSMLRACNYNPDECISNHLQIEGDDLQGARNAGDDKVLQTKDHEITELKKKLKETENKLSVEMKAKNNATVLADELQARVSGAEAEAKSTQIQLDSLQQSRPKTARPKTPIAVVGAISDEDLNRLMKDTKVVNQTYIELKMDVKRWITEMTTSLTEATKVAANLKMADSNLTKQLDEVRALYRREAMQRRMLYNQLQELRGNIRVFLRCRKDKSVECCMKFPTDQDVDIANLTGARKKFQFDKVFDTSSTQEQVFEDTCPIVTCCVDGYNVCIMAYGQTGSGKTYTIIGPSNSPGVNIRTIMEILRICKERADTCTYVIKVSLIEIYNENIQDLLTSDAKTLELRAQGNTVTIPGIIEMEVNTLEDIQKLMKMGEENRTVASTKMNSTSSRSHLVMMVNVIGTDKISGAQTIGKLMLCDLAGSERISKTDAVGQRLVEAAAINKSLSALGQVFSALRSKQLHIPYRNSKLTHILQPALGGDAKACLFVNVSPDVNNLSETLSSLQFGSNARQIQLGQAKQTVINPGTAQT